jgi:hypothetical protein
VPPNRATRRKKADDSPGMRIEVDGRTYVVRESDLTPRDIAALRRETGFAGWIGLTTEAQRGFDLDVLAALVWLARRIDGDTVAYESVLDELSYDSDLDVSVEDKRAKAAVEAGSESPEA